MITMKTSSGIELSIDGTEDLAVLERIRKLFAMNDNLYGMRMSLNKMRKDLNFVVRQFASVDEAPGEPSALKGTRRLQFDWVKEYLKADPGASLYVACQQALNAIQGEDGYQSLKSLHRYCCAHRTAFTNIEYPIITTGR